LTPLPFKGLKQSLRFNHHHHANLYVSYYYYKLNSLQKQLKTVY